MRRVLGWKKGATYPSGSVEMPSACEHALDWKENCRYDLAQELPLIRRSPVSADPAWLLRGKWFLRCDPLSPGAEPLSFLTEPLPSFID